MLVNHGCSKCEVNLTNLQIRREFPSLSMPPAIRERPSVPPVRYRVICCKRLSQRLISPYNRSKIMTASQLPEVLIRMPTFTRRSLSGTTIEITDGIERFVGEVKHVSRTGIEVLLESDLDDQQVARCFLRLSHGDHSFQIAAIPIWLKKDRSGSIVGMRICAGAPRAWFCIDD
jgi:hypothetical protein